MEGAIERFYDNGSVKEDEATKVEEIFQVDIYSVDVTQICFCVLVYQ
jgi:hypothetical protein